MKLQTIEPSLLETMTWRELFVAGHDINKSGILPPFTDMYFTSGYQVNIRYLIPYSTISMLAPTARIQDFHQVSWLSEMLTHRFAQILSELSDIPYEALRPSLSISSVSGHKMNSSPHRESHLKFLFTFELPEVFMIPVTKAMELLHPLLRAIETFDKSPDKYALFERNFVPVEKVDLLGEWFRTSQSTEPSDEMK